MRYKHFRLWKMLQCRFDSRVYSELELITIAFPWERENWMASFPSVTLRLLPVWMSTRSESLAGGLGMVILRLPRCLRYERDRGVKS